jgi:hypothetical protein
MIASISWGHGLCARELIKAMISAGTSAQVRARPKFRRMTLDQIETWIGNHTKPKRGSTS